MDNKRRIVIVVLAIVVLIILVIICWWILKNNFGRQGTVNLNTNVNRPLTERIQQLPPPTAEEIAEEKKYPLGMKQLAYSFAERFGSYSNLTVNKNLNDLRGLMTVKMQAETDKVIDQTFTAPASYDGYDTRALESELLYLKDNEASILIKTQRSHYLEKESQPEVYYQNLQLKMVKVGEEWKIDEAKWQ
ncbi:MAG: hypothetical protein WC518_00265 [Patescibacteria group bacterium]